MRAHPGLRPAEFAWWDVMGFESGPPSSLKFVEERFRQLAAAVHPDRGGSTAQMQRLIWARIEARRQFARFARPGSVGLRD